MGKEDRNTHARLQHTQHYPLPIIFSPIPSSLISSSPPTHHNFVRCHPLPLPPYPTAPHMCTLVSHSTHRSIILPGLHCAGHECAPWSWPPPFLSHRVPMGTSSQRPWSVGPTLLPSPAILALPYTYIRIVMGFRLRPPECVDSHFPSFLLSKYCHHYTTIAFSFSSCPLLNPFLTTRHSTYTS